jgi:hypothetical protein
MNKMAPRLLIQFLLFLTICGPVYAGKQAPAPASDLTASAQDQQAFTQKYWEARDKGGDALTNLENEVKGLSDPTDYKNQNTMLNNLNAGKAADGSANAGFHGDPTDSGPSNWSNYDIQTDANGNITGFKLKDFDKIDLNHDGQLSDDELAKWKKQKDDENKRKGGPPGFRPPKPPPGVGPDGKLLPGFSLTCFRCTKLPSTANQPEIRCHGSEEGPCTTSACPSTQECEQYAEKSDNGKEEYFCHNCEDKPKDNCENHGLSSDGNCGGKCEQDDICVPVDYDTSTNSTLTSGSTREAGRPVLQCFDCKNRPSHTTWNNRICTEEGYSANDSCDGQCPAADCEGQNMDVQSHQIVTPGQAADASRVVTCYACKTHETMMDFVCAKDGYSGNASCDGKCAASDCEAVGIDDQTHEPVKGTTFDKSRVHTCYQCKTHETMMDFVCAKDGYSGNASCDGKCAASDCEAVGIDDRTHQPVSGSTFDKNRVYTCYMCKTHSTVKMVCPAGSVYGTCPGACSSDQDCVSVASGCAQCNPRPMTAVKKKSCEDMGMSDGESCVKSCAPDTCIQKTEDDYGTKCWECQKYKKAGCPAGSVPGTCPGACPSDQVCQPNGINCAQCSKGPWTAFRKFSCEGEGFSSNGNCDGKCTSDQDCGIVSVSTINGGGTCFRCYTKPRTAMNLCPPPGALGQCPASCGSMDDCIQLPGQCYQCKTHSAVQNQLMCPAEYYSDASCGGKCPDEQCLKTFVNTAGGSSRYSGVSVQPCYYCVPTYIEESNFCHEKGYFYDDYCDDECPEEACHAAYFSSMTKKPMSWRQAYDSPSAYACYYCEPYAELVRDYKGNYYVVIILETLYERVVLNRTDSPAFKPEAVMALAKVDPSTGMIPNVNGDLKKITDFVGGLNAGFGPGGITTTGSVSMDQLTNSLKSNLSRGGDYGANCFDDVKDQADQQASSEGKPTSKEISQGKQGPQDRGKTDQAVNQDAIKTAQDAGEPAVSGPVVACGTQNGNKVLKVYDAAGHLVDSITQAMLKANPDIILQKLGLAQSFTDKVMVKTNFDFAGLIEKFTGLPLEQIQAVAAQVEGAKGVADQALHSRKSGKQEDKGPIVPNDPLYKVFDKKKSSFLGIFGGDAPVGPSAFLMGQPAFNAVGGSSTPDLDVKDQYYLRAIGYTPLSDPDSAWNVVDATQKNLVVAVVDSGLDLSHPDAPQYLWANPKGGAPGWNFVDENTDFTDYRGHGTFVTGIIAAKWNNATGIAGINPGAVIMPIKVTDDKGKTDSFAVWRGINFAVNHGARIINVSLGGQTISKLEQQAIARANAMGALVVVAAGNTNDTLMSFGPASSKNVLSVGMVDFSGQRSLVSNWGPNLQLVAPGEQIWSLCSKDTKEALPSVRKFGYYKQSGTSFSTPMVTATASLVWAKNPALTAQQVADIIRQTATPIGKADWSDQTGFGMLNAAAALRAETSGKMLVSITNLHFNRDVRGRLTSLDIYGTVRGSYKELNIEAGRGKQPMGFRTIAGPFHDQYDCRLIARLVIQDVLRGSDEWVLRLKVSDDQGKEHIAATHFIFPGK